MRLHINSGVFHRKMGQGREKEKERKKPAEQNDCVCVHEPKWLNDHKKKGERESTKNGAG